MSIFKRRPTVPIPRSEFMTKDQIVRVRHPCELLSSSFVIVIHEGAEGMIIKPVVIGEVWVRFTLTRKISVCFCFKESWDDHLEVVKEN